MHFDPQGWHLATERLLILPPQPEEGAWLYPAVRESLPELQLWMPWARDKTSPADLQGFTDRCVAEFASKANLEVRMWTHDGTFVGCIGLMTRDKEVPSFEIGYWCRTPYSRRGYTSEAVRALTTFAFDHLKAHRLEIRCDTRNEASRRVAEKCGYQLEAVLHHDARDPAGQLRDTYLLTRFTAAP